MFPGHVKKMDRIELTNNFEGNFDLGSTVKDPDLLIIEQGIVLQVALGIFSAKGPK